MRRGEGEGGGGGGEGDERKGRERGELYLTLCFHHRNEFCIKMGSDEKKLAVSLAVKGKH